MNSSITHLSSLLFETTPDYNTNLQTLLTLIKQTPINSIVVAPEVCLTGFDYDNFEEVLSFAKLANAEIQKASQGRVVILTVIEKKEEKIYNLAKVFYNQELVHERRKARLFHFGGEGKYFSEGIDEDVCIIEVAGVKLAILVCFELRFKALWQRVEGADVIAVPAWWGVSRSEHYKSLTQTLAIMNQCYVIASDSLNAECSKMSAIITPQGKVHYNGNKPCLEALYNKKEIALMRRYMDVGIKQFGQNNSNKDSETSGRV